MVNCKVLVSTQVSWGKVLGAKESSHFVSLPGFQRALSRAISVTLHLLCLRVFMAVSASIGTEFLVQFNFGKSYGRA